MMKNAPYFEGWYCKCRSCDGRSLALIPAMHRSASGKVTASLQVLTEHRSWWVPIPVNGFHAIHDPLRVRFGACQLTQEGLWLNLCRDDLSLQGTLRFGPFSSLHTPIMGPFRFVPGMECSHSVLSMSHSLSGVLSLNGDLVDFTGGEGYLESDQGDSFPQSYLWTQCSWDEGGLMLALASVPILNHSFTGCICAILLHGKELRLATYKGARVECWSPRKVQVHQGKLRLSVELLCCDSHPLRAPVSGEMCRIVRESLRASVRCRLWENNTLILDQTDTGAGFECAMPGQS